MKANAVPTDSSPFPSLSRDDQTITFIANSISNVFCPPLVGLMTLLLIGGLVSSASGWFWLTLFAITTLALPSAYILLLVHSGKVSDIHLPFRSERIRPLCFMLLTTTTVALAARWYNAPNLVLLIGYATVIQTVLVLLITLRWKISLHCLAAAELATICLYVFGLPALLSVFMVFVIAWSRLYLHRHTFYQTVVGSLLGVLIIWFVVQYQ